MRRMKIESFPFRNCQTKGNPKGTVTNWQWRGTNAPLKSIVNLFVDPTERCWPDGTWFSEMIK